MIYLLNLYISPLSKVDNNNFYYHILGALLSLFENNQKVYDSILKLSFYKNYNKNIQLQFSILGKENYNYIINELLEKQNNNISINGKKYKLNKLKFDFEILDIKNIKVNTIEKFKILFKSPTFVRNNNVYYTLPNQQRFIYSIYTKIQKKYNIKLDEKGFKEYLKNNIYVGEFSIKTKQVKIKDGTKAGVVGYSKYYIKKHDKEFDKKLYLLLKSIKFVGIGNSVKLGCGNCSVYIYN